MIDFHTHIMPSIDDGAKNMDETINLIEEAKNVGFDSIVLTPHYIENDYDVDVITRKKILDEILKELHAKNINMELYLANEVFFSDNIIELIKNDLACTVNNTKYILFELPMNAKIINLYDVIYEMQKNEFVPILVHPERYKCVQENPELVYELIKKGVYMQANYGSIDGQFGKKAKIIVKKLLKNNMIHFLGTDVHRQNSIYPKIPKILAKINKIIGQDKLKELTSINPKMALENKDIEVEEPKEIKLSLIEKIIMKK